MVYDYLIYPANLLGIVAAKKLIRRHNKILLINRYGFAGGNITSALNIVQKSMHNDSSSTYSIFNLLERENGFFLREEEQIILNPEIFKFVCQKQLTDINVELLFHVRPIDCQETNKHFLLKLISREGLIEIKAKRIIDLSEGQELSILNNSLSKKLVTQKINLISAPIKNKIGFEKIEFYKLLDDGRMFISQKIYSESEVDEMKAQETINEISEILHNCGSRVQILPVESQTIFNFTINKMIDGFFNFASINLNQINDNEIFIQSQKIESYFDKI